MFRVVHEVMTVDAQKGEVVDVGAALCGCVPRDEVMCLAFADVGPAADAAFVTSDQPTDLGWCCVAVLAALVEDFAFCVEHGCSDGAVAGIPSEHGLGDDAPIGEFAGVLPGEKVVEFDPHMNVALHRPGSRL